MSGPYRECPKSGQGRDYNQTSFREAASNIYTDDGQVCVYESFNILFLRISYVIILGNPCNSFVMSLMDIFIFRTKFLCHHRHHLILMVFGLEIPQKLYIILEQMSGLPTVLMTFQSDKQDTETKKG